MQAILGIAAFLAVMLFGLAQFIAGYVGIEDMFGTFWAWAALLMALWFRFMLPVTIGAFFGAMNVWEWHWAAALVFALPGLLFIIPGVIGSVVALVRK